MNIRALVAVCALALGLPATAWAQNAPAATGQGVRAVADVAAPGRLGRDLGAAMNPRYASYARKRRASTGRRGNGYAEDAAPAIYGAVTYEVASAFRPARDIRYTVANEVSVLVDDRHRIIEILP